MEIQTSSIGGIEGWACAGGCGRGRVAGGGWWVVDKRRGTRGGGAK